MYLDTNQFSHLTLACVPVSVVLIFSVGGFFTFNRVFISTVDFKCNSAKPACILFCTNKFHAAII